MDYKNGKIYSIRSHQTDKVYIGSTTQPLYKRLSKHRSDKRRYEGGKINYITSFEIINFDDVYIELVELCPSNIKEELLKREGEIIRNTPNCVNKIIQGRTQKEYKIDHKERIQKRDKEYRQNNVEHIHEQGKEYRERLEVKKHILEYREKTKEHKKLHDKEYYEANKEKIKLQAKQNHARKKAEKEALKQVV